MTAVSDETDLKRNEVLSFDDGLLTIKISGHGAGDGWGSINAIDLRPAAQFILASVEAVNEIDGATMTAPDHTTMEEWGR